MAFKRKVPFSQVKRPGPTWKQLQHDQYFAKTAKERTAARVLCDRERGRLADLDKANGTKLLLKWTIETTPSEVTERERPAPLAYPSLSPTKVLKRPGKVASRRLALRRPAR